MTVPQLAVGSHDQPDELRSPEKTRLEVVRLPGFTIGRMNLQPGWRWSECIQPVVGGDACQVSHVGYLVSGTMRVRMVDGTERTIRAGESYTVPPGHDAWVEGSVPVVAIEVMSADQYAKAK